MDALTSDSAEDIVSTAGVPLLRCGVRRERQPFQRCTQGGARPAQARALAFIFLPNLAGRGLPSAAGSFAGVSCP